MRILILGKNSFIGNAFSLNSHYQKIHKISLQDILPEEIPYSQFDVIIFFAAIVHQKKEIPLLDYFNINSELPFCIAKLAKNKMVKQFIYISSASVYGDNSRYPNLFNESSSCNPKSSYGKSKLAAEELLMGLNSTSFTISIVRPPLVFGPNVKANMLSLIRLVDKLPILPFKSTKNKRSIISVRLLSEFIDRIIDQRKSGIFVVTDPRAIATSELITLIAQGLNKKIVLFNLPGFIKTILYKIKPTLMEKLFGSFILENNETIRRLNFRPESDLETEILNMALHYKLDKQSK